MTTSTFVGPSLSGGGPTPSLPDLVTARERQVLRLAANGNTNRAIGRQLGVDEEQVKRDIRSILRKLGAADRTQAVAIGMCLGLIGPTDIRIPVTPTTALGSTA